MKLNSDLRISRKQIIVGGILLVLAIFLLRVALWERDYYSGMEGRERAVAISHLGEGDTSSIVDESEVTEEKKVEYVVPASHPRYISIERLGIDKARVLNLGLTKKGALATPSNIFDTGWYNASGTPGSGGTILLDGHNGGPTKEGVFKHLPDMQNGDLIVIENGAGGIFHYKVVENIEVSLSDADNYMETALQSPEPGRESVTIISCSGSWNSAEKTYNSRQFVRAVRV